MALQIDKQKKNENNRQYAYRVLHKNIMNLWLEPGTVLNESELCQLFGMSRTPIHEAIIQLRNEHLVEVQPQSASTISKIDLNLLYEGYFLRLCVEPIMMEEMAGKLLPQDLESLKAILQLQEQVLRDCDVVNEFFALDDLFHQKIYEIHRTPHVWTAIKGISSHFDRVRFLDAAYYKSEQRYLEAFYQEHVYLYQLLLCGIPKDIQMKIVLERHVSSYKKSLMRITEQFPHYFANL